MKIQKIELFLDKSLMEFYVTLSNFDEFGEDPLGVEKVLNIDKDYNHSLYVAEVEAQMRGLELVKIPFEY